MEPQAVKLELQALARTLAFAECRVARCTPAPHAKELQQWLDEACHGEMAWMERNRERRSDPGIVLPGAKSVIVLAMNYWQGKPASAEDATQGARGKIARYAWGDDYHDRIEEKLKKLEDLLAAHGGAQRRYVDTGPILERDFAAEAGVGWHGKSTMLISEQHGAWFFLAEVLTTLELPPDAPVANRCGSCQRCITACPTGAITHPHRVDARKCVSYLTIELKGSIPLEMRPLIGDRIYGCDDCAAACPWNRFAAASTEAAFNAREHIHTFSLRDYLALDDEAFRTLFRGSPIKRIKRRGFLRNVCVALGNVGGAEDLPVLERAAADPEPLIAEHARWALERIRERHPETC